VDVRVETHITYNRLPEIIASFPRGVQDIISKTCYDIETSAKHWVPVDTGALWNSIYAEVGDFTGQVSTNMEYAGYVEFGTSKMPARSYMRRSADYHGPRYVAAMNRLAQTL